MNKLRIFQNIKNKERTVPGLIRVNPGTVLLIFLFLPYIITVLSGNGFKEEEERRETVLLQLREGDYTVINETAMGKESIPLELYVADRLFRIMKEGYQMEALKAQAVLIRGNLIAGGDKSTVVCDTGYGKKEIPEEYLMAVMQTKGIYAEYEGETIYGAYFRVSSGESREAGQMLTPERFPYLTGAVCERDFLSEEYTGSIIYGKKEFEEKWDRIEEDIPDESVIATAKENNRYEEEGNTALLRDTAGYVLFFRYADKWVRGEQLRYELSLPSCNFRLQEKKNKFTFSCKGVGHGFGMSQFGANEMALDGKTYVEILQYFFTGITFTKIS